MDHQDESDGALIKNLGSEVVLRKDMDSEEAFKDVVSEEELEEMDCERTFRIGTESERVSRRGMGREGPFRNMEREGGVRLSGSTFRSDENTGEGGTSPPCLPPLPLYFTVTGELMERKSQGG